MRFKLLVAAAALLSLSACSKPDEAARVLRQQGYTNIITGGYSFFGCSKDDTVRTNFEADAPNGERVSGTVCGGFFFKNNTVRLD